MIMAMTITMRLLTTCDLKQPIIAKNSKRKEKNTDTHRHTFKLYYIHEIQSD